MLFDVFDKAYLLLRGISLCFGELSVVESGSYRAAAVLLVFGLAASVFVVPTALWVEARRWVYNLYGASVFMSILDAFIFVGGFVLSYYFDDFYLSFNKWVYDVKDMGYWFNSSFLIWLFAKDRKRWAKWTSGGSVFGAVLFGSVIFLYFAAYDITLDVFAGGFVVSIFVTSLFAWLFYKYYTTRKPKMPI